MNVFFLNYYYKTLTVRLDNIVAIVLQKNHQFALAGLWQMFATIIIALLRIVGIVSRDNPRSTDPPIDRPFFRGTQVRKVTT